VSQKKGVHWLIPFAREFLPGSRVPPANVSEDLPIEPYTHWQATYVSSKRHLDDSISLTQSS
jgi:hypothetical protein